MKMIQIFLRAELVKKLQLNSAGSMRQRITVRCVNPYFFSFSIIQRNL